MIREAAEMHLLVIISGAIACVYFFWLAYILLKERDS